MQAIAKEVASSTTTPSSAPTNLDDTAMGAKETTGVPGSRRLLVLLHGEKANDDMLRNAISRLRKEGHQVTVRVTYEAGDVDRLVKEALTLRSADTLVAAGGDGTINEVVAALLQHTGGLKDTRQVGPAPDGAAVDAQGSPPALQALSVGILPMGTSNDFAATTGIPEDPYEALLLATRTDSRKAIDVGLLNGKVFMNTATIGASAEIGKITSSALKKILGPAAFLFTGVRAASQWRAVSSVLCFPNAPGSEPTHRADSLARAVSADVAADVAGGGADVAVREVEPLGAPKNPRYEAGAKEPAGTLATRPAASKAAAAATGQGVGELEGVPLLHITAANNRQVASMVAISPDALLDDGLLDCVYLTGDAPTQVKRLLWSVLFRGPSRTKVTRALLRVPWLEVACESPIEWSVDGEPQPAPTASFRFSLLPRSVHIHFPDDRMLVAGNAPPELTDDESAPTTPKAGGAVAEGGNAKRKHKRKLFRVPYGKLRPPTLADMMGRVVRFRKRKDWGKLVRNAVRTTVKTLLMASLGGLAVHWWHTRRDEGGVAPQGKGAGTGRGPARHGGEPSAAGKRRGKVGKRHAAIAGAGAAAALLAL